MTSNLERPIALIGLGSEERSVLVGAPQDYDLTKAIVKCDSLRIAIAFGHLSGWNVLESAVLGSEKKSVEILLGRAFFQTEPRLLLLLRQEALKHPYITVKLAPIQNTFHPKTWILRQAHHTEAIVGSGNMSAGGLAGNIECGLYTSDSRAVAQLENWFTGQWKLSLPLDVCMEDYIVAYDRIRHSKKSFDALIQQAKTSISDKEARQEKNSAVIKAQVYWNSEDGRAAIQEREQALQDMRHALKYPNFNFDGTGWESFLNIPEFGRIRQTHNQKTIAALADLKLALKTAKDGSSQAADQLMSVPGIGRNLASKLMVVCDSEHHAVVNTPVLRALDRFAIDTAEFQSLTSESYERFLRNLKPFSEKVDELSLPHASALDAFFFEYGGTQAD